MVHVDQRFAHIDQRFEQVDKRFDQVDKRFEQVHQDNGDLCRRFDMLQTTLIAGILTGFLGVIASNFV